MAVLSRKWAASFQQCNHRSELALIFRGLWRLMELEWSGVDVLELYTHMKRPSINPVLTGGKHSPEGNALYGSEPMRVSTWETNASTLDRTPLHLPLEYIWGRVLVGVCLCLFACVRSFCVCMFVHLKDINTNLCLFRASLPRCCSYDSNRRFVSVTASFPC